MRFILECTDEPERGGPLVKTTLEFHAEAWPDVLPYFDQFLRGCGYAPRGELVYDEKDDPYEGN